MAARRRPPRYHRGGQRVVALHPRLPMCRHRGRGPRGRARACPTGATGACSGPAGRHNAGTSRADTGHSVREDRRSDGTTPAVGAAGARQCDARGAVRLRPGRGRGAPRGAMVGYQRAAGGGSGLRRVQRSRGGPTVRRMRGATMPQPARAATAEGDRGGVGVQGGLCWTRRSRRTREAGWAGAGGCLGSGRQGGDGRRGGGARSSPRAGASTGRWSSRSRGAGMRWASVRGGAGGGGGATCVWARAGAGKATAGRAGRATVGGGRGGRGGPVVAARPGARVGGSLPGRGRWVGSLPAGGKRPGMVPWRPVRACGRGRGWGGAGAPSGVGRWTGGEPGGEGGGGR